LVDLKNKIEKAKTNRQHRLKMVKLYLAVFLSVCLVYAAMAHGDSYEESDNHEDNDEKDLISHIKQFKQMLLQKKQHKPKPISVSKAIFVEIACEANTCPKDCPGSCGSYQDSLVCVCKHASCKYPKNTANFFS
jgi:hypothetical protein